MKKDHLNPFNTEHDTPEEKAQSEREDKVFRYLMSCSTIVTVIAGLLIILLFVYFYLFN